MDRLIEDLDVDEKVWQVRESDHVVKGQQGARRVQRVWVVRGEDIVEFQKDLGPSSKFPLAKPFIFVAGNEYSVGEALEQAEYLRDAVPEPEEPSDMIGDWFKQLDEMREIRKRRSVVGPWQRTQRN